MSMHYFPRAKLARHVRYAALGSVLWAPGVRSLPKAF